MGWNPHGSAFSVISSKIFGQWSRMGTAPLAVDRGGTGTSVQDEDARLRSVLETNYDFIWRTLRRLGLDAAEADDGAQQVFLVTSRRLAEIRVGGERAYLFGIACRVAADARKRSSRRHEQPSEDVGEAIDPAPNADEMLDQQRARALLDAALEKLPIDLRHVFTLHELEEMSMSEIAEVLGIPPGTVASRLRRAREDFEAIVARMTKRAGGGAR
jgi:RNA polymerase sigma-70 factor (ECF subfamily)